MKKSFSFIWALIIVLAFGVPAFADQAPQDRLKEGLDKIVSIITDPVYHGGANHEQMVEQVSGIAHDYFDFQELASRTVPNHWQDFSAQQQQDFTAALRSLLESTYLLKLDGYTTVEIEYERQMVQGNRAMVLTNVHADGTDIPIAYRLINHGQWMVYDISFDNAISLVKNYRSQFSSLLQSGATVDDLIQRINDKVAKLAQENREES